MSNINFKHTFATLFALLVCHISVGQTFTLRSNDLGGQVTNEYVFNGFGCTGDNLSPSLEWSNPPAGTKSFAITMYDPDAPTGSGWWHWVVFDIPSSENILERGVGNTPNKHPYVQIKNDYNVFGYGGPCPPQGDNDHRYIITIYALKIEKLGLDKSANAPTVGFYLNSNAIAKASIIAYYSR